MREIFRPVLGYEGHYEVSNIGTVRSVSRVIARCDGSYLPVRERIRAQNKDYRGYMRVTLCKRGKMKSHLVHALVLEAFVGPRADGMEGCHNNGIQTDNRVENLRWASRIENERDKEAHGTSLKGEAAPGAKLNMQQVNEIRRIGSGMKHVEIATMFGVARQTVQKILAGETWK